MQETSQVVGAPIADADASEGNPFAGGYAAVQAQNRARNDLRHDQQGAGLGHGP